MRTTRVLAGLLLLLAAAPGGAEESVPTEAERAGRAAFIELKCTACHRVLGDPGLPAPVASEGAPVLGGLNAVHTREELELAILSPSHSLAPGFKSSEGGGSRMGTQLDSIRVDQLEQIVAYLKGQEDSGSGWRKEGP